MSAPVLVACQEAKEAGEVSGVSTWPIQTTGRSMELAPGGANNQESMARLYKKGEGPRRSDKEFCYTVGARRAGHSDGCAPLCSSTAVGISIPMYTTWGTKKRSFKSQRSWKSLI